VAGLINVVDALLAVRTLVYERQAYSPVAFLSALDASDAGFQSQLRSCPCFGVDDDAADQLAADFTAAVFTAFDQRIPFGGGSFLPSSIQFSTYADAGKGIPATPDGRQADAPLADSIGAIHGKDRHGPTALLNSVARLPQSLALGTPVLNLRLQKSALQQTLRPLIEAYFAQGGLQVQVSYFSRADLIDALAHPEKHEHLIVRIGGYAEYFNRLSPELKQNVLARTEHS
jgi:formate C-acetyltransferase